MALGKKVKTLILSYTDTVEVAGAAWGDAIASHTFQDDVRVIGFQVGNRLLLPDAMLNADHQITVGTELSRHGVADRDGVMARCFIGSSWTAAISPSSGQGGDTSPFCFPDGHGIDFDDGEVIYLHAFSLNVGTVSAINGNWAVVYYVER